MAKKKAGAPRRPATKPEEASASGSTLKELLSAETLQKLKAHADSIKDEDRKRAEAKRAADEEAKRAEEKRLANDFGHLLDNSRLDWKSFK